jgi:hypothetical protein
MLIPSRKEEDIKSGKIKNPPLNKKRRVFVFEKLILAPSYFGVGLPLNYRRRSSVSPLSSGWIQCGSTAQ